VEVHFLLVPRCRALELRQSGMARLDASLNSSIEDTHTTPIGQVGLPFSLSHIHTSNLLLSASSFIQLSSFVVLFLSGVYIFITSFFSLHRRLEGNVFLFISGLIIYPFSSHYLKYFMCSLY
jgi:hypothetical protein